MAKTKHTAWQRHLDTIGEELLRLSIACDVKLRDPNVIDRILKNDETVCGTKNTIGFKKLRNLLMATFNSLNKAMDRIGPDEVKMITDGIREWSDKRRALGKGATGNPDGKAG
jgi:replicative DNA helicase